MYRMSVLSTRFRNALLALGLALALAGCGLPGASGPTATPDYSEPGGVLENRPGPTNTPLPDDEIPPSLPITNLVPFTHEPSGITGLRPDNWTIFSGQDSFQISSSPEAPDGFIGRLVPLEEIPEGDTAAFIDDLIAQLQQNQGEGPPAELIEEKRTEDGATLLAEVSGQAQGSTKMFRYALYARFTSRPDGVLMSLAMVPAEKFSGEEQFVREMVDSLTLP